MDRDEARQLLRSHLDTYRRRAYAHLAALIGIPQIAQLQGSSGTTYQVEVQIYWDAKPGGALRILGTVDDGGRHALKPLCDDFILRPDGSSVGQ